MRIYKKRPFAAPNSARVNELAFEMDRLAATRKDLVDLRQRIKDGTLSAKLYDFINMDGSLENLLVGLPRPLPGVSCEALQSSQLMFIDAALEDVDKKTRSILQIMWDAFKEWILDWWDVNRRARFELQQMRATYKLNPGLYGDIQSFESITTDAYHKPYWEKMLVSCQELNKILLTIPSTNIQGWVETNLPNIKRYLADFGQDVVIPGLRVSQGNPVYDKTYTSLGAARWRFQLIGMDLDKAINILADDIAVRRMMGLLEQTFANAEVADKAYLSFVRQVVMKSKANTFVLAHAVRRIMRTAASRAKHS